MTIYRKIATQLRDEIVTRYSEGDLLPPEKQLADRFGVNRHTVRRAIDELVQDGLVRRYQGLGNRVVQTPIDYALHDRAAFSYNLNRIGLNLETEVIDCKSQTLPLALCQRLFLPEATPCVLLTTRRFIETDPASLIRHYLIGVDEGSLRHFSGGSLHHHLRQHHQLELRRGTTRLHARMPTLSECEKLDISRGVPVMEIHTQNYQIGTDRVVEYSIALSRSDLFEYRVEP